MFAEVMKMREEEKKQASRKSGMQRFFKKRWVYPAVYITAAALILTSVLWYQSRGEQSVDPSDYSYNGSKDNDAVEVTRGMETFAWPVLNPDDVEIKKKFYDANASEEEQVAALVFYDNTYHPNTGIDIGMKNGEEFDVVAAMSGEVTNVEEDALLGNKIVIEHSDGVVTQYQSVKDIQVKIGDKVKQGQKIAKAGKSMINEEAGVHVHFEIRKDNVPVDPLAYFKKSINDLKQEQASESEKEKEGNGTNTEGEDKGEGDNNNESDDQDDASNDGENQENNDDENSNSSNQS
jgi:stage II sporulation protein Q